MKIKTGDNVMIMAGKDRDKTGKVTQVFPRERKVVVDQVNKVVKHMRAQSKDKKGQKLEFFAPVAVSNVMLVCPNCSKPTRVGYTGEGKDKHRICKKCKKSI